jgi:DDE superfamily endonuclease
LLYLPAYSPNLHLIERLWRFIKKQCLYSKYYPDSQAFQQAILTCIQEAPTTHQDALKRLLTLRFQTFQKVAVVGEQQEISTGTKNKVLSKAA